MNKSLLIALALSASFPLAAQEIANQDGRYIIQFKNFQGAAASVRAAGGTPVVELAPQSALAAYLPAQAVAGLQRNPNVLLVEADPRRYPMAQTTPYGITMVQADQVSDANAGNATVCIIDSGYYRNHEDLDASTRVSGSTDAGSGNWFEDSCGHGTHVAGTVSALQNTLGVRGVLNTGKINIRAEKVFDGASCAWSYSSNLVAALNACRSNTPASQKLVVSMSLGGSFSSSVENNAFQKAYSQGVLSVAAAGNGGNKRNSYPASYASVISVAAVDSNKNIASFSQQNSQVELAAPGVGVLSTVPFASSSLTVGGTSYHGENIDGSARKNATGNLFDGGLCSNSGNWSGGVVLCQRGIDSFATKVANVLSGGGVAAVIYNNASGGFAGTLSGSSAIPAISISQEDGQAILGSGKLGQSATVTNAGGAGSGYAYYDGTSMATPHVSGVAALVWSNFPGKSNADVRAALQATAEDLGPVGRDSAYGYGLVQAKAAYDYLNGAGSTPTNNPPTASFNYSCIELLCNFTDTSVDTDGTIANWDWNFGDGSGASAQNPGHTYAAGGTYDVVLTVTDNQGATGTSKRTLTVSAASSGITLSASGRKVKGVNTVDLVWSGAASGNVDVLRDATKLATVPSSSGAYTDNTGTKGGATLTYQVCESGTTTCSGTVQVIF